MRANDRLDEGLELLRACSREQAPDLDLEERMMKEFSNANRNWMPRLGKMAAGVLLCMTVAGVAVAATGGLGWIFELTGTVEMPNGDTYDVEDGKLLDDDGNVIGTVEIPGSVNPDGEMPTVDAMNIHIDDETVDVTD
jgi:hypothetical protein